MCPDRPGHRFRGRVQELGAAHCLDLPGQVSRALRAARDGRHPVRVVMGGIEFSASLEPRGDGLHRLYLPPRVWKELHAEPGDLLVGRISSRDDAGD